MSVSANIYHDCQVGGGEPAGIFVHPPSVDHQYYNHLFISNGSESSFPTGVGDDNTSSSSIIMEGLLPAVLLGAECMPWLWAAIGSCLVGLSGILPLLVIPIDQTDNHRNSNNRDGSPLRQLP